jgi:phosphoglycolate phosphatase-like HAD superfamily hydrolase
MLKRAGTGPSQAIGDEMRDMDAANAAGIAFGGVAWGYADPAALRARNPQAWFDTVADIPRLWPMESARHATEPILPACEPAVRWRSS